MEFRRERDFPLDVLGIIDHMFMKIYEIELFMVLLWDIIYEINKGKSSVRGSNDQFVLLNWSHFLQSIDFHVIEIIRETN